MSDKTIGKKGKILDIPYVDESELGSESTESRMELLRKLCEDGRYVPTEWLLAELGNLQKSSLHSLIRRLGYRSRGKKKRDGKSVTRIVPEEEPDEDTTK